MKTIHREKVFGEAKAQAGIDGNAKARIMAFAKGYSRLHRAPGQHSGPLTKSTVRVLWAVLSFGARCFPSYEAIATRAGCHRDTVAVALQLLERARVLTWRHRLVKVREYTVDLFGNRVVQWRVLRTSNWYRFFDPRPQTAAAVVQTENPTGNPDSKNYQVPVLAIDPTSPLWRALASLGRAIAAKNGNEQGAAERSAA